MPKKAINIDRSVLKASKKHKLPLKQTMLLDATIKNALSDNKKTNAQLYQENIATVNTSKAAASANYNRLIKSDKYDKALKEVLRDENITKKSILKTHLNILDESINEKQLSTARNCNKDLMELEGMTQPQQQNTININVEEINNYSKEEVNNKLSDIINGELC